MSLIHRLRQHIKTIDLDADQIVAVNYFLKTRKEPAKIVSHILKLNKQQVIEQIVVLAALKIIGQDVADSIRAGEYSVIKQGNTFDIVVWTNSSVLTDSPKIVDAVIESLDCCSMDKLHLRAEWIPFFIDKNPPIHFCIKNFNLGKTVIESLFAEFDKAAGVFNVLENTAPTNIYYCKLI